MADSHAGKTGPLPALFCCFLAAVLIMFIALPKAGFSNAERRRLQEPPVFSVRTVFDGSFEDKSEDYVSDHFPFRLFFVGLNSYMNLATGRTLINETYVGKDSWFMQQPAELDEQNLELNLEAVRELKNSLGIPASILAVPSTGFVMGDKLPKVHLPYEDMQIRQAAQQIAGSDMQWIDVLPALQEAAANGTQVYYRTDHHWTTAGAYEAYRVFAASHGFTPAAPDEFAIETYGGFRGTTFAKVQLWNVPADDVELWTYPANVQVTEMDADTGMEPVETDSFYDMGQLEGYDPYAVFFGGNHSVVRIRNEAAPQDAGRLLMLKDSYANCFLPFLARHYSEIVVVDPRYFRGLTDFLAGEEPFDELLCVYGISQLVNDEDLGQINL